MVASPGLLPARRRSLTTLFDQEVPIHTRPRPLPTGLTAAALYLPLALVSAIALFGITGLVGLPPIVATTGVTFLVVGFPIAVLLAVILRPEWLRTTRRAAAAAFSLNMR